MSQGRVPRPRRAMGELEAEILDVLWDADRRLTPTEVGSLLPGDSDLAYTTVMTVLTRLFEKGVLTRERQGRAWAYAPVFGREEYAAERMNEILRDGGDRSAALARFVDRITPAERARLRKLLETRGGRQ